VIQAGESAPREWTWYELQKGFEANVPALSSARVTVKFRSQPPRRDPTVSEVQGPPAPESGTLRFAWDRTGRFRCELVPETGDNRTFEAVFDGSATKVFAVRNGRRTASVTPGMRGNYAGIEPRDAVFKYASGLAVDFLAKNEPRVVGRGESDGTPTVTVETAPIPDGEVERILRVRVAPERRFAIVRTATAFRRVGSAEWKEYSIIEMHGLKEHRSGVWLPERALVGPRADAGDNPGGMKAQKELEFENWDLDPDLPDALFEFEFPDGAVVSDRVAGEAYRVRIVDGQRRREFIRSIAKDPVP
jgi:outer membrane lipoprotein-sorting protein